MPTMKRCSNCQWSDGNVDSILFIDDDMFLYIARSPNRSVIVGNRWLKKKINVCERDYSSNIWGMNNWRTVNDDECSNSMEWVMLRLLQWRRSSRVAEYPLIKLKGWKLMMVKVAGLTSMAVVVVLVPCMTWREVIFLLVIWFTSKYGPELFMWVMLCWYDMEHSTRLSFYRIQNQWKSIWILSEN